MLDPNIPAPRDDDYYDDEGHWAYEWDDAWDDVLDTLEFTDEEEDEEF